MLLVDCEDDGFSDRTSRVLLRFLEKGFAHHSIARGRKNLSFQVLNLEVLVLFIDHYSPARFGERLCGYVRAHIKNLGQTQERTFRVLDRINDVVPEGRHARFAPEVMIGVAKLPCFGFSVPSSSMLTFFK